MTTKGIDQRLQPYGTLPRELREEIESIDWDALSDENRLRDIGIELYDYARYMEDQGHEHSIAIVAAIMDGFWSNRPQRMHKGDGQHIANGFARKLMLDHIAQALDNEEDDE